MKRSLFVLTVLVITHGESTNADDWPMWRRDAARSAASAQAVPDPLNLQWIREELPLEAAYHNPRLQFDGGYEPIILGKTLLLASSRNDSVMALDTESGRTRWQHFTDGPVRVAPVGWQDCVYVASDDGHLVCLDLLDGALQWQFRAVPSDRKLLGNRRLISVWPIRGGPVLADGRIYFAAGVWPLEGIFIYCLDARTGEVIWRNDRTGYLYGQHPHAAEAFGGLTPQGYLLIQDDQLVVPCGTAMPARLDLATGELKSFELPKQGRLPGGWFTAGGRAQRRGNDSSVEDVLVQDNQVNRARHEGGWHTGPGDENVRTQISAAGRVWSFEELGQLVAGDVHSAAVADDKLFVTTQQGHIYCFSSRVGEPSRHASVAANIKLGTEEAADQATRILAATGVRQGCGLVWGLRDGNLAEQLVVQSSLMVIAVDPDPALVDRLRRRWDSAGLYGTRMTAHVGDPQGFGFPPYLASLIVSEDLADDDFDDPTFAESLFESLRPFGGTGCLALSDEQSAKLAAALQSGDFPGAEFKAADGLARLIRSGPLPGAVNYTDGWVSPDERVKAPLGVLWFDDTVGHFKRSPQPMFWDGVMISYDKDWMGWVDGDRPPYALSDVTYSDVYTGRMLSAAEASQLASSLPTRDIQQRQPEQYRPPTQTNAWSPASPVIGQRINPLTGKMEPRAFPKSYGCDGGVDYGRLYTMRSGTAAFYDKQNESGTVHISGPRSGCTNSVIPANGLLNVPYFYQGCTCSYPLPSGLAMVSMPESFEQWTVWGPGKPEGIRRVGLNFAAPGDRMTDAGTLWLDTPSVGGPSPDVDVQLEPESVQTFYRHSLWIEGGDGYPWVVASGLRGVSQVTLAGLAAGEYRVRLYFAEPDSLAADERVFDVLLNGRRVLQDFDIAKQAGGSLRGLVREFHPLRLEDKLVVQLQAHTGQAVLCGLELISQESE